MLHARLDIHINHVYRNSFAQDKRSVRIMKYLSQLKIINITSYHCLITFSVKAIIVY